MSDSLTKVGCMSFAMQKSELLRARATARKFSPHLHSTYSVVALKRGTAEIKSARWSGIARAGDVFFFNPYEIHSALCSEEDAEYHTLYPSVEFLAACLSVADIDGRLDIQTAILEQSSLTDEMVDALFTPLVEDSLIEASLRRVLSACAFITKPVESCASLASRACLLIQRNSRRAMRTDELAREMGVHQSHLVRAFSKAVGMAPQTYMRQVRVAEARQLICEGLDISEVALMLEFSDQAHLTREFKKVFGVPPGALSRDIGRPYRPKGRSTAQARSSD